MNAPDRHLTADPNTAMESKLRQRLTELRTEYHKGQQTLRDLEGQAANVRATLLRISGAVQVLAEALGEAEPEAAAAPTALQRLADPSAPG